MPLEEFPLDLESKLRKSVLELDTIDKNLFRLVVDMFFLSQDVYLNS